MIKQESPSSNSSDNNSPDSNPTLPGSPEAPTDTSDHSTPAGAPAGAPANAPAGTPPETIELRVCWEGQVGRLIDKKMLHGLGPKSVISILEKLFCLLCLLLLPGLPPSCSPLLSLSFARATSDSHMDTSLGSSALGPQQPL